jgi:hypothetical protein
MQSILKKIPAPLSKNAKLVNLVLASKEGCVDVCGRRLCGCMRLKDVWMHAAEGFVDACGRIREAREAEKTSSLANCS